MNNEDKILSMLGALSATLDSLAVKVDKLEQGQVKLEQGQAKLESDLVETKAVVMKIEVEQGQKLAVLFDGYNALRDTVSEIQKDIVSIKEIQEKQGLHIKLSDQKVQKLG